MLLSLTISLLVSAETPQPRPTRTWYEQAEADLLCTALATDEERRSLHAPTVANPRDASGFTAYFRGQPRDERHARFRHLAAIASVAWWANRVNDQAMRTDAYRLIEILADGYATATPADPVFRQISRCASAHVLAAAIASHQPAMVDAALAKLDAQYRGPLATEPVTDWPLLLAAREARLDPTAKTANARLATRAIELAGHALRARQTERASRLLAAGAAATLAMGDANTARDLAMRSLAATGTPPSVDARWRAFPLLFDSQERTSGIREAAKLSALLERTTPPASADQRDLFASYLRLAIAADAREDYQAAGRHQLAAFRALADQGSIDTPSLPFYQAAIDQLLGRNDSTIATVARLDPQQGATFVRTYLGQVDALIKQAEQEFVDDVRSRAVSHYRIDNVLFTLSELARVRPADRNRIADATFRAAQTRSFSRLSLAAITSTARRAGGRAARADLDRFFSQETQNGTWLRAFLAPLVMRPGGTPPDGATLWRTMFALDVFQNETTKELPAYVAMVRREVPDVANLLTPRPVPAAEFQRRLGNDEALVATVVSARDLHVWVLTKNNLTHLRQPVRASEVTDRVTRLRASLKPTGGAGAVQVPPFDAAAAHDLYRWIFSSTVAQQLRDVRSIIWYGNGPLGALPPGVLVSASPSRPTASSPAELRALAFLADRFAFSVLPDLSLLPVLRDAPVTPRAQRTFLGIGAPLVSQEEIEGTRRARSLELAGGLDGKALAELPKLVESVDEMKGLAALFGEANSTLWLGPAAEERKLASTDLTSFRTLAFATHGFLADEVANVREPSLMLALQPEATDRYDGILTATEIASLRLNADLVILSACNTGGTDGRPSAETFSGLTQAFLTAGARNLMVSHWPVVSGAAVRLSVETTRGALEGGQSLPRSLQAAMQALRKDASTPLEAHPAYWGPFVIVGDGR